MSDEATAASCEFPWVLPSEYCSHVDEQAQSCSYNLPLPIQPKWLLTQLRLHNTTKCLFMNQNNPWVQTISTAVDTFERLSQDQNQKKLLIFSWPIKADFRGPFCSAF